MQLGGEPFAPEREFSLSAVAEECSSTALFFDRRLGMPMRVRSRGTARPETAALLCRRARRLSR
jgi:hypothetical protein